jgi:hypothetical protein
MNEDKQQEILDIRRDRLEEKKERKLESYERLQQRYEELSGSSCEQHKAATRYIPMGQPILTGHHSEGKHRAALNRSDNAMRKSIEHDKTAKYYEEKKEALLNNRAISSDDPDAIEKLKRKLAWLERGQAHNKAINKIVKAKKSSYKQKIDQLVDLLNCSNDEADKYFVPDFCGRIGIPDYVLTNNGAEIRRCKKRIEELQAKLEYAAEVECEERVFDGFKVVKNYVIDRIQIVFDGKPEEGVRKTLKSIGFRWSPSESAWQRQLSQGGIYAAENVIKLLANQEDTV